MSEEIGVLRIDLTLDQADFTRSVQQIDTKLRALNSEFRASAAGNRDYERTLEGLRAKNEMLGNTLQLQRTKVDQLRAEYERVAEAKGRNSVEAEKLATKYNNAVAAMRRTEQQIGQVARAMQQQESQWQNATTNAERYTETLEKTGHKIRSFGDNAQSLGNKLSVGLTVPIAAFGVAAGAAAKQFDDASAKIQMSLGATAQEAKNLEANAKNLWKDGFGESLEEVTDALIKVKQNMKGIADGKELEKVTRDAMLLAQTFESDVNEVTRAGNNLMVNFGIDSKEAFDLLAYGAQKGLNFSGELFDNVAEYSGLFSALGFEADEYFQVLMNGSEKGVYNLDYLNDAVKEFGIRIKDGSASTTDAIAQLFAPEGIDQFINSLEKAGTETEEYRKLAEKVGNGTAKEMVKNLQKGGKSFEDTAIAIKATMGESNAFFDGLSDGSLKGSEAMQKVIGKIQALDDPTERATLGVALFGTKWEDLEEAAMYSLTTVGNEMDKATGTMDKMAEVQDKTFGQRWNEIMRTAQTALLPFGETILDLAEEWLPKVSTGVEKVTGWFDDLSPSAKNIAVALGGITVAAGPLITGFGFIASGIGSIVSVGAPLIGMLTSAGAAAGAAATGTGLLGGALTVLTGPVGIAIGAITALGVAYALTREKADEQLKKEQELAENNLKMAESHTKVLEEKTADIDKTSELIEKTNKQAENVANLTTRFETLWEKSKLSREEFAIFLDLQSELENTTSPKRVEELEQRMAGLREKSGLSNEEFAKLLSSNETLMEIFPQAGEVVGEYGNRIADTTGKLQAMTQAELNRMELEVYNRMISDLEAVNSEIDNYEKLLGEIVALEDSVYAKKAEQRAIQQEIADNESIIIENKEKLAELTERQKDASFIEWNQLDAQKNELKLQNFELENKNKKSNENLEVLNETLKTENKTLEEKQKQSEVIGEQVGKNRTNLESYTQILEKNLGINIEKGKELKSLDDAIAKNKTTISQLQERIKKEGDSNGEKQKSIEKLQEENRKIDEAKLKLDGVIKNIDTQNGKYDAGQQKLAKVNAQFDLAKQKTGENITKTDVWNGKLDKSHTKKVDIKQNKDPDKENEKWSKPISKVINVIAEGAKKLFGYADGTNYHPGGMAFMGEKGYELFKVNGMYGIANFGLYDLPKGAKVWTHEETKQILSNGLDVSWNAKGGIFDKPTIFATANAGLQGVGEAGAEAIAPIDTLLGYVRTAVAETMALNQVNMPSTIVVKAMMNDRLVGEGTAPFVSQKQHNAVSIAGLMKGVHTR